MGGKLTLTQLRHKANDLREDVIQMLEAAGSGHSAGAGVVYLVGWCAAERAVGESPCAPVTVSLEDGGADGLPVGG